MYTLEELQSGRYVCRGASPEHKNFAIYYDVFVPGNGSQILLSTKEKKLFVPPNKEHAYIPCAVSDSTAAINLYKGNHQQGTYYQLEIDIDNSNGSITFNPRKGFKLKLRDFINPWGTYLCISERNRRKRKVHLFPEALEAQYDPISQLNGRIPVHFAYEYEFNRVICCSGTSFTPILEWAGCGSLLDCQVKSSCFEGNRCEPRLGYDGFNQSSSGPRLPQGCAGYGLRDGPNGDFGMFKCSTPGVARYQPYLLNRGNIFFDFTKTPRSELIITFKRMSPEQGPLYVGDELEFHCNSTRFYFAYGVRWAWERNNGEIELIDDSTVVRDQYFVTAHRRRTTLRIPHADIKSIVCFVPVVNSASEWRTASLPVLIYPKDSAPPPLNIDHQRQFPALPLQPNDFMIEPLNSTTYQHMLVFR